MKNLKKKTKMKSNIFGIEYTAEEVERMVQVMFSARQFMKTYGKGAQPKIIGDDMTAYIGNVSKAVDLDGKRYTSKTAPDIYVKDVDLYKVTSLTLDEVHRASKNRQKGLPLIACRTYDRPRINNGNAFCYEYNLPSVLMYEERLKYRRELERKKQEQKKKNKR